MPKLILVTAESSCHYCVEAIKIFKKLYKELKSLDIEIEQYDLYSYSREEAENIKYGYELPWDVKPITVRMKKALKEKYDGEIRVPHIELEGTRIPFFLDKKQLLDEIKRVMAEKHLL